MITWEQVLNNAYFITIMFCIFRVFDVAILKRDKVLELKLFMNELITIWGFVVILWMDKTPQ